MCLRPCLKSQKKSRNWACHSNCRFIHFKSTAGPGREATGAVCSCADSGQQVMNSDYQKSYVGFMSSNQIDLHIVNRLRFGRVCFAIDQTHNFICELVARQMWQSSYGLSLHLPRLQHSIIICYCACENEFRQSTGWCYLSLRCKFHFISNEPKFEEFAIADPEKSI